MLNDDATLCVADSDALVHNVLCRYLEYPLNY